MRKISLFMMVSADGYFEGPDHDIRWHHVDAEFNDFAAKQLDNADMLLFGRRTYDLMASFWPTEATKQDDPVVSSKMNAASKIVFSRSDFKPEWENTRLISTDLAAELNKLKAESGGDLLVLGSSNLGVSLIEMGLLDEVRLMINPVVLGNGTTLFHGLENQIKMGLTDTRRFKSGNILNSYQITH